MIASMEIDDTMSKKVEAGLAWNARATKKFADS
jgi:hypothetical protein